MRNRWELGRPKSSYVRSVPMADQVASALHGLSRRPRFTAPDDFPYHGLGEEGNNAIDRAYEYADVLDKVGGLLVWDPQTEVVISGSAEASDNREDAARKFIATSDFVRGLGEKPSRGRRSWRFWTR